MDFDRMISYAVSFYHTHTPIAIAIAIAVFIFGFWKPKIVFKIGGGGVIVALVFYLILLLGDLITVGTKHKDKMSHKTEEYLK